MMSKGTFLLVLFVSTVPLTLCWPDDWNDTNPEVLKNIDDDGDKSVVLREDDYVRPNVVKFQLRPKYGADLVGPMNSFQPEKGARYVATLYARILNNHPGALGQLIQLMVQIKYKNGQTKWISVAKQPMARTKDGWIKVQGDFVIFNTPAEFVMLRVQGPWSTIKFEVKDGLIERLWEGDWRKLSDSVINKIRKHNIEVRVEIPDEVSSNDLRIEVVQTKKSFPIGTAVNSWTYSNKWNKPYRDFIHEHFNYAVHESALKWPKVEPRPNLEWNRYNLPRNTSARLMEAGVRVRGHNILWTMDWALPGWVTKRGNNPELLRQTIKEHIHNAMDEMNGYVDQWDVNNENLHGFYFQEKLNDFEYELEPYRIAHKHDPSMKLFLNDFDVVAHGQLTTAYVNQGKRLVDAKVGLYGLGAQCHYYPEEMPDPYQIKNRLDRLAKVGLSVWITEFNIVSRDENKRADMVEKAMRAYYGHPAVDGILLWGFWDQAHFRGPYAVLANGHNVTPNAAGRRFLDLWEKEWMTRESRDISLENSSFTIRGFHGDYKVNVFYQGNELPQLSQVFTLDKKDKLVKIRVDSESLKKA